MLIDPPSDETYYRTKFHNDRTEIIAYEKLASSMFSTLHEFWHRAIVSLQQKLDVLSKL